MVVVGVVVVGGGDVAVVGGVVAFSSVVVDAAVAVVAWDGFPLKLMAHFKQHGLAGDWVGRTRHTQTRG